MVRLYRRRLVESSLALSLLIAVSATAQVPLFSDDFATPDLDGWASGLAGCDVTTGVWSVQDQVLVFEQETCDAATPLVADGLWQNFQ